MEKLILALVFISFLLSALSLLFSYNVYLEIQKIKPYLQLPKAIHLPATATFTGNFVKVTFSLLVIAASVLFFIFKKCLSF